MTLRLNRARTAVKAEDPSKEEGQEANEEEEQAPQPPASKKAKKAKAQDPEKQEEASDEGEQKEEGETTGKGARAAERGRLKAILNAEGADGFSNLAMHLATETALSAATCAGIIAAAMEDVSADDAPAPARSSDRSNEFRAAMKNDAPNPKIGSGRGRQAEEDELQKTMREMGVHKDCKA